VIPARTFGQDSAKNSLNRYHCQNLADRHQFRNTLLLTVFTKLKHLHHDLDAFRAVKSGKTATGSDAFTR
jgi:hypothetical protein